MSSIYLKIQYPSINCNIYNNAKSILKLIPVEMTKIRQTARLPEFYFYFFFFTFRTSQAVIGDTTTR